MVKLTIFTPVYNREKLILRLYDSIIKQTFKDFEWIIVDDGSTDNTANIIRKIISENKINIKYYYKKNGGKHTAYNLGIQKATGELFVIVDSDDIILKNGFKQLIEVWENLDNKQKLLGISGIDLDSNLEIIGTKYPKESIVCSHLEIREIYKVKGDKTEIFRTNLLKENYFPVFKNEKFLTEAILFEKLYKKYKTYFINVPLIIRDYQKNGLSDNSLKLRVKNPIGATEYYKQNIELCLTKEKKIKSKINFYRFSLHANKKINTYNIYSLIARIMFLNDKIKLRRKSDE